MDAAVAGTVTIRLHPSDNVVVARTLIPRGTQVAAEGIVAAGTVPAGHKIATRAVPLGQPIYRYGQIIGFASREIAAGEHVHSHNCAVRDFNRDYAFSDATVPTEPITPAATFNGIVRADGRIATRNYVGILSSVNCSATVS